MGLFDKIKAVGNKVVSDVTSEESKEKAKDFFGNVGSKINDVAGNVKNYVNEAIEEDEKNKAQQTAAAPAAQSNAAPDGVPCRDKLLSVLANEFPGYAVAENISPLTIGGTGRFMNYSIGVYNGGMPVLFIMIVGKTTCSHREYRFSKEEAAKHGIPMINFVEHYPNETSYISGRLHKYI